MIYFLIVTFKRENLPISREYRPLVFQAHLWCLSNMTCKNVYNSRIDVTIIGGILIIQLTLRGVKRLWRKGRGCF